MKIALALCLVLVMVGYGQADEAQAMGNEVWIKIGLLVFNKLKTIFQTKRENIVLFNRNCVVEVKGQISKFKWTYKGTVYCPGWTGLEGNSRTKSARGAVEDSVKDFIFKVRDNQLVSLEEAQAFLNTLG